MATSYATVAEYRLDMADDKTSDERIEAMLAQQSAKLRAEIPAWAVKRLAKNEDALLLARTLVTDASAKRLVTPSFEGVGEVAGATQASFSANGFSTSYQLQNPSGAAYWDMTTLADFKRLLGCSQTAGTILPGGL